MTYPHPAVRRAIVDRFVPLRLDLFADRDAVRPLNVVWTPTVLFADRRGTVHHRSLHFLPPADFLDLLDIGEASTRLRWAEYDRAIALLAAVTERDPAAPLAPEAIFLRGIATYLKTGDGGAMEAIWRELRDRFPDSIWTRRVS